MEHKYVIIPKSLFSDDIFLSLSTEQQRIVFEYFVQNHWSGVIKVNFRYLGFRCGMTESAFESSFLALVHHYPDIFFFDPETREFCLLRYPSLLNKDVNIDGKTGKAIQKAVSEIESKEILKAIISKNPTSITGFYDLRMRQIMMDKVNVKKRLKSLEYIHGEGPGDPKECKSNVSNDNPAEKPDNETIEPIRDNKIKGKGESNAPSQITDFQTSYEYWVNFFKSNDYLLSGIRSAAPTFNDSLAKLLKDYLIDKQEKGEWYALMIPSGEAERQSKAAKIQAGLIKWAKARVRFQKQDTPAQATPAYSLRKNF